MSNRDDRYYTTHRARTPAADQSTVFFQGQGGRTLLPPISSAFPTSSSPVPSHSNPYSQPRSSPNRFEYNQASYNNQWQPNTPMAPHPQPGFGYYEDPRYSAQAYPVYAPRPSTVAPGQHSEHRKLPPLSTTPGPSGREDRWAAPYPTPPSYNGSPPNSHIRSPTASYPASYASAYPAPHAHGHGHGYPVNDPRYVSSLSPQLMANDPRAVSPFGRSHPHASPPTPPPIPIGWDESTATKKRKRADANQLRVPNETYVRIASLSTEECFALVKALDMSPRSVQICFERYNGKPTSLFLARSRSQSQSFASLSYEQMEIWNRTENRLGAAVTGGLETVLLITHEALQRTSEILAVVPVPGLQAAAKVLLDIWDSAQATESNRLACLRLTQRCADILLSVCEEIEKAGKDVGDELTTPIEKLVSSFTAVYNFMMKLAHCWILKRYFKREQILRDIANCDTALTEALSMFSISIQIRILKQIQAVELSRQSDTRAIYECVVRSQQSAAPVPSATLQGLGISHPTSTTGLPLSSSHNSLGVQPQDSIHSNAVLPTLQNLRNTLDLAHDTADLRTLMREAVSQSSDAEMIRVLQAGRDEMPEALQTLQRALERVGVVNSSPSPCVPPAEALAATGSSTLAPQSIEGSISASSSGSTGRASIP